MKYVCRPSGLEGPAKKQHEQHLAAAVAGMLILLPFHTHHAEDWLSLLHAHFGMAIFTMARNREMEHTMQNPTCLKARETVSKQRSSMLRRLGGLCLSFASVSRKACRQTKLLSSALAKYQPGECWARRGVELNRTPTL